ncbi:4Fe-4S dicluster domain-containing protein [Nakamurella panacisegetis]|uniref:4Fe-4S dicluster domain-containing protein n=1 Tax=Nakamurella panacisegetis TaxID=1090615 RepID=A0A1H0QP99_9ACTN|nr:4Fe-4S dicluster domain-containing protein [Nakamurella panacisegetis]SDP18925.1 4Fe-4S dicluster domain-containing protein [Nakamurella panacisegetis]
MADEPGGGRADTLPVAASVSPRQLDTAGLQALIDVLAGRGYTVIGPTISGGAIVNAPIRTIDDLPRGWGDDQDAAHYRLRHRDDDAYFGFASGAQSAKPVFFPTDELLWRGRRAHGEVTVESDVEGGAAPDGAGPVALLGVRSCDLHAIAIHDRVLGGRVRADAHYVARRDDAFIVSVSCTDPGGTCFCVSMGTGPRPENGPDARFDLSLTELLDGGGHRFVVEVGSARGAEVLTEISASPAPPDDLAAADEVAQSAAGRMGRTLDTDGIKELLYASVESPRWDDVASRCLACGNCTMVCPTCFCTTVEDIGDLTGDDAERHRFWDSCFDADFSYIHGGTVRASTKSRYRQWMTHKLGSWIDQFGTSGCVGCGRCVTWCPAAIDITAEAAALRGATPQPDRPF